MVKFVTPSQVKAHNPIAPLMEKLTTLHNKGEVLTLRKIHESTGVYNAIWLLRAFEINPCDISELCCDLCGDHLPFIQQQDM